MPLFGELPPKINILGQTWALREETREQSTRRGSMAAQGLYGLTMPHSKVITIRYGLSPELRDQIIMHELAHASLSASGDKMLGHDLEEHIVGVLEVPLTEALKQLLKK